MSGGPAPGAAPTVRWALLALVCVLPLRFPGALPGPLVVSADDHLTVHHIFQSEPGGRVRHPALSDPAVQLAALDAQVQASLRRAQAPLWNPQLYGGAPLLADAQSAPLSARALLGLVLPPGPANDLAVALTLLTAGLGLALLARSLLPAPERADAALSLAVMVFAGASGMLSPYLSVWLLHPHAGAAAFLPWALLAVVERRPVGLAFATLGLSAGGHPGTLVHGLGLTAATLLGLSVAPVAPRWAAERGACAAAAKLLIGLLCGILMAGPLLLPLAEQAARSTTLHARVGATLAPAQLLDLLWPGWHGHPALESATPGLTWADGQLHPGLLVLPMLVPAAVRSPAARGAVLLWGLSLIGALTGLPGPFAHSRLPSLVATILPAAAALGLPALWRRAPRRARRPGAAALIGISLLLGIWVRWPDQGRLPAAAHRPAPAPWAQALGEALQASGGRVLGLGWAAQPNTGALAGLRDLRGYDLPVSTDTQRLMAALSSPPVAPWYPVAAPPPLPLLQALGVRALLFPPAPADAPDPYAALAELRPIALPPAPLRVVEVPDPAPRAWIAAGAWRAASPEAALDALRAPQAWWTPGVERPLPLAEAAGPPLAVEVEDDGDSALILRFAPSDAPQLLVINAAWAPGWRARADDRFAPTFRAGGFYLAALVPPGASRLRAYYRPDGWIWGTRAAALGIALLAVLAWPRRRS